MPTPKPRTTTPLPANVIDLADRRRRRGISTRAEEKAALIRLMTEVRDQLQADRLAHAATAIRPFARRTSEGDAA